MIFGKKKKEKEIFRAENTNDAGEYKILDELNVPEISYDGVFDRLPKQTAEQKLLELEKMDDLQFEFYICKIFQLKGYDVRFTPVVDDYGADLIIERAGVATAIRCRQVNGGALLDTDIVEGALAALKYYPCDDVMIITNGYFTKEAARRAFRAKVSLVDRNALISGFLNYKITPSPAPR